MKNRQVGYGIIGIGSIANTHAIAIKACSNSYVAGCAGTTPAKSQDFASRHGCKAYASIDELLRDDEIDAVVVASPSGAHLDCALKALEAGRHVLVEKPLEITGSRCDQIIEMAKSKGLLASGIFQSRFYEAPRVLKNAIVEGRFGRITMASAQVKWFRSQQYYDSGAWRGTMAMDGGGALMNQAIHAIDLLCWLAGPVAEVQGYCGTLSHQRIEVEDTAAASLKFSSGALGTIEASTSIYPGFLKRIEICGTKGSAVLEEEALTTWAFESEKPEDADIRSRLSTNAFTGGSADPKAINCLGHQRQLEDYSDSIINGHEPFITASEASVPVRLICGIYESARTNRPVTLSK